MYSQYSAIQYDTIKSFVTCTWSTESEEWAVIGGRGDGKVHLREAQERYCVTRFFLKEANDELLRIWRGSFFYIEGAA